MSARSSDRGTTDRGFAKYLTDEHRQRRSGPQPGDVVDGVTMVENSDYRPSSDNARPPSASLAYAGRDRGMGRYLPDGGSTER
ncbi:hypothetical protein [Williamsia herbipolensis]|uniref:hypothetical protein n=1 Tax=Williamsia herbipolensis TaxID=1603258 RepID=UPI0005F7C2C9|nr:hypothetical protein [Williamsia herbipolensis]